MFAINIGWTMRALWKIGKGWIDEFTQSKIHIKSDMKDYKNELDEFVDPDQREERFGGSLPNITNYMVMIEDENNE